VNKSTAMELAGWARQEAKYHRTEAMRSRETAEGGYDSGKGAVALGHDEQAKRLEALAGIAEREAERSTT